MSMRMLPALCAGLILAACADDNSPGQDIADPSGAVSTGMVTPGDVSDECGGATVPNVVGFETDSATLAVEAQTVLQKQAAWLSCFAKPTITIEGHADERGTREYNLGLGERRAQAVMNYLIALRVDPKRLKTISYGKERPVCTEADEACWSQNRRGVSTVDN
jgi:peptidoglycan-associated lipoprotein